ncbi:MAG TPA: ATP-dependent helicase HrpB [Stellaceae bacterium]|nr:ATP-dependent helicase HrpB [Stellaceae bacterium]
MTAFDLAPWRGRLPVADALERLEAGLAAHSAAVLEAPPGAGKTTLAPLALLASPWLGGGRIVMLEPRRLAARAAARRMAMMLGERPGETVGYRTRLDSRVGPRTRIEVVTEGVLIRMLQDDPSLAGTGLVIFDEFHERSLDGDLGLALALDARRGLREDLRLLVMSATLDGAPVARLLGDAPVIESRGRMFDIETRHLDRPPPERIEEAVAAAIQRALTEESGSLLVFLPGAREIRRVEQRLADASLGAGIHVTPLYGDLPQDAQDAAIAPPPRGTRKIVLATAIAETSLTIDGVRVVIDAGLMRRPRFDPRTGMTRLMTLRVSQAASEQRRGRAGRVEPGVCYRLWPAHEQALLQPFTPPEIMDADLAPLALELARWGVTDPSSLSWLDPPPAAAYAQANTLLRELDAVDADGRITSHGRALAVLGAHPRLAHMAARAKERDLGALAADIAALLSERDIVKSRPGGRDCDLRLRIELLHERGAARHLPAGTTSDRGAVEQVRQSAQQWRRQLGISGASADPRDTGSVVALAYPDRIAQRRAAAPGSFRLASGSGALLPPTDPLAAEEFLAVAELDGDPRNARIFLAAPLARAEIEDLFATHIENLDVVAWDSRQQAVLARRQRRLGAVLLADDPLPNPAAEAVRAALLQGLGELGLDALPWTQESRALCQRVGFVRRLEPDGGWPDLSETWLASHLDEWLGGFLGGVSRRAQLERIDLLAALKAMLPWDRQRRLDELAPTHITVPSGSRLAIDYGAGDVPVLAVKLQEMFGHAETPSVGGGRTRLLLHLLSPAGRPLQVTADLATFWKTGYRAVRSEMRGRYPKHPWPEDPLAATPTARAKRRGS